jgi:ubiquinone/menaquinone biosynthesis C-methylase UbiE
VRRTVTQELLDHDAGSPTEIADGLADLRFVNRWFGGSSTLFRLVSKVAAETQAKELSLLDVAGASGDVAHYVQARMLRNGVRVEVAVIDRSPAHLGTQFPSVAADALHIPFRDGSFDVVCSSLFLHHLEPDEVVRFSQEALRVARVAVVINDLRRSALHLAAVYAGFPLHRSRMSRHDGPASVCRSYTVKEMREMLAMTKLPLEIRKSYFFRIGAILWKAAAGKAAGQR